MEDQNIFYIFIYKIGPKNQLKRGKTRHYFQLQNHKYCVVLDKTCQNYLFLVFYNKYLLKKKQI